MSDIVISKYNESYILVDAEADVFAELQDFFTFEPPNAFWMRKKRPGWNGKIYLLGSNRLLYAGLLTHLLEFAKTWNYKVDLDRNLYPDVVSTESIEKFIESLDIRDEDGELIVPYDHQYESVIQAIKFGRRTIVSPTASGKSLIIYILIRYYQQLMRQKQKILVVVPTIGLVTQLAGDFWYYSQQDPSFDAEKIHKIAEGSDKQPGADQQVVISTWQSIYKESPEFFNQFGLIIGDECHQYKAEAIKGILEKAISTKYRIGLTGTLSADGSKCNKLVIQGLFGPSVKVASTRELMDKGIIAPLEIQIINARWSEKSSQMVKLMDYKQEIDFITNLKSRNTFLCNVLGAEKKNTLALFLKRSHGEKLFEMTKKLFPDRQVFLLYGKHPSEEREEVRKIMEKTENAIAICSYGVFSTGINVKNIHSVVFASPSKSAIRVLQSIGRGLRKHETKDKLRLIDVVDVFQHSAKRKANNYCVQHGIERQKIYATEDFDYKIIDVNMED